MAQISIIKHSDVLGVSRYDAEYFKPEDLALLNVINTHGTKTINQLKCKLDCSAFYPSITDYYNFNKKGIPFLRVNEIQNGLITLTDKTAFLPEDIIKEYKSNIKIAYPGDILIAKGGNSLAKVGLLTDTYDSYSVCRDLIIIRTNKISEVNKYYLWLYLHSKIGQKLMLRTASQTGQPHLTTREIQNIPILVKAKNEENAQKWFFDSIASKKQSKKLYKETENILLRELKLLNFKPKHSLSFETTKSKIDESLRFDSEYYQPKYKEIIKHIENYVNGFDIVKNVLNFNKKNFFPKSEELYNYIPLSKVSNSGEIDISEKELGCNLPTRARRKVKKGEIILSSIEGSLETSALINKEHEGFIVSNGFYVFDSDKINSETLFVLFKSKIMIELLKQISKGAILGGYDLTAFEKIKIPLINESIQKEISLKLQESFKLRKESKDLLEKAKKMVEDEIEKEVKK